MLLPRIFKKGFTMIELLVVIAVIGILAVALLATLNPLEQIRKGRDTGRRADASQLASALERYNASIGYFPWEGTQGNPVEIVWADLTDATTAMTTDAAAVCPGGDCTPPSVLGDLTSTSEVKSSFIDKITTDSSQIYLSYGANAGSSIYVCFKPESNTFSREAYDRCVDQATKFGSDFTQVAEACPLGATGYTAGGFDPTAAAELICLP